MRYNVISTDDHLQEAPGVWTSRMSRTKWGENIPHLKRKDDGTDAWWAYGEEILPGVGHIHATLKDRESGGIAGPLHWEEVSKEAYVPSERIKAMDRDGVDVHTFFANVGSPAGQRFSAPKYPVEFRLEAIRAYNDYQIEEWAAPYPGRFITLAQIPLWDVELATGELRRMAGAGIKGITFALPQQFDYPPMVDRYWDPLWDAAQEADLSINLHLGSGGSQGLGMGPFLVHRSMGPMARSALGNCNGAAANSQIVAHILFSGLLERFPRLKVVSSESGIGWVPYLLELADHNWERLSVTSEGLTLRPSEYFHRQCYVNFWSEIVVDHIKERVGIDNLLWLSDFPHPTSTWPDSQDYLENSMARLTSDERRRILVDNPVGVFNLEGG